MSNPGGTMPSLMRKATLAFVIEEGRVLLGRKVGAPEIGKGTLNGPGGKKEPTDATLEVCLERELLEEVGVRPLQYEKRAILTFMWGEEPGLEVHTYMVTAYEGTPIETESMIPEWHSVNAVPFERMLEADRRWLPRFLRGECFNATVWYQGKATGFGGITFSPFEDHD